MQPHHANILLEEGKKVRIPGGVTKHFVKAQKRRRKPKDAAVFQPLIARVRREGNKISFMDDKPGRGGFFNIFMPEGVSGGDELYVLWVDPKCACMVTPEQWVDLRGKLPEQTEVEPSSRGESMVNTD